MREYGKIHSAFWMSESVRQLSDDGRMLALYLLTCPHGNMLGCFRIPDGYISDDLIWPIERVSKGFEELSKIRFATRCNTSKWVLIYNFLEYNPFENPNVGKAAAKVYAAIPNQLPAKADLTRILRDSCQHFPRSELNPSPNPSKTLLDSARNPEPEPEPNQSLNQNRSQSLVTARQADAASQPESIKSETELQAACRETWAQYSAAFFNRYRTEPVRNAKVNGQVKQFVQRLGFTESPAVAAFYLQNNLAYYVQRGHVFDCLLSDAEKLRTEWATGRTMTATRARQIDKKQANYSVVDEALELMGGEHAKAA